MKKTIVELICYCEEQIRVRIPETEDTLIKKVQYLEASGWPDDNTSFNQLLTLHYMVIIHMIYLQMFMDSCFCLSAANIDVDECETLCIDIFENFLEHLETVIRVTAACFMQHKLGGTSGSLSKGHFFWLEKFWLIILSRKLIDSYIPIE